MTERAGLLKVHNRDMINASAGMSSQHHSYDKNLEFSGKKENQISRRKYFIGALVAVIAILIGIIIGVYSGKEDSNDPKPTPPNPEPLVVDGYNLYKGEILVETPSAVSGIANFGNSSNI